MKMKYLRRVEVSQNGAPLEEQLKCMGYFGFGSGFALGRFGPASDTGALYCNRCAVGPQCWQVHRDRVRSLFPEMAALADEVGLTHKGAAFMTEFLKRSGQGAPRDGMRVVEPYTSVMMGNTQDAAQLATSGQVMDRGRDTLTWPLKPLT